MLLTIRTWRACCLVNTTKTCTWDCLTPANIFLDWVKLCEHNQLLFHQDKPKKSRQLIWKGRSLHPYWSHSGAGVGMPRGVLMQEDSAGWSLTVSFNSLVELANQWKPYLHFFTFFPFEVHGALQNIGNLLHYIVEKSGGFFSFFFLTNWLIFFLFIQLEVIFRFSCSLQTPTALRVFAEGLDSADSYWCKLHWFLDVFSLLLHV